MKNLHLFTFSITIISFLAFFSVSPVKAQDIDVDNNRIRLRAGTGHLQLLSNNGELLYQQYSTGSWTYGITARVNGNNNQRGFLVKNHNWHNVFEVFGSGVVIANGQALTSDSIYKEEIRPLGSEFDKLMKINAKQYKLKADEKREGKEKKTHYGFIAQELEEVFPDMIFTNEEGIKSIFYTELIPVLIEAVKAQQAEIESQNKQLLEIEKRLAKLELKKSK